MMQIAKSLSRLITAIVRGSRRLIANRSGVVATEYGLAMALMALGMLGGTPAQSAVPLPVAKPVAGFVGAAGGDASAVHYPAAQRVRTAQAGPKYASRTTVVIMYSRD